MRYRIVAIGRSSRGPFGAPIARYLDRLRSLAGEAELVEPKESRARTTEARREGDGAALLAAARGRSVALDERGRAWSTRELAEHVAQLERSGHSRLSVLVGGADGLPARVRDEVDEVWSLSSLTLPHELALVVVLEQLYRIESLRANHPYHRA